MPVLAKEHWKFGSINSRQATDCKACPTKEEHNTFVETCLQQWSFQRGDEHPDATAPPEDPVSRSRPVEDTPPAAGTGDTGGEVSGHPSERCSGSDSIDPGEKNEGTLDTSVRLRMEGLQQSYDALQLEFQQQQELLERRNRKLQEIRNQIHAKDLQLSALRHEIRIKDALLSCLQDEERQHFEIEDFELQTLLEKALSPLTAILTRQMGTAGREDQAAVQHGTPNLSAR